MRSGPSPVVTAAAAAAVTLLSERVMRRAVRHAPRWQRRNYRDRAVVLSAGPAAATGALVAAGLARAPGAVAVGTAAAGLGLYDDLYGDSHARGLRGHIRALAQRRVTTGMVKLVGMAAAGFLATRRTRGQPLSAAADAALIAGTANLVNLLDLRPGRALKVLVVAAGLAARVDGPVGGVALGTATAAAVVLPSDLGEQVMIGDCGANGLGALLGWSLASGLGRRGRAAALVAVIGLTVASERVSFTAVIDRTPWLSALDRLGRR